MSRAVRLACLVVAQLIAGALAAAEPVTTIRSNGSPANRIDIVILGDGYSAGDLASGKYAQDVETAVIGLFSEEPYTEYQRYFNVHRVDLTSPESGADHPSAGIMRETALDATFDCGGIQRLVCVNTSKVYDALSTSVPAPEARDVVLVLVNDAEYGGSGGAIAVASTHPASVELVLHEVGHSFGLLADEYESSPPACNNLLEPPEANVTRQTMRHGIKWRVWIEPSTPLPTPGTAETPGLYQGGKYCVAGLYRPTYDSKMRSLGRPFGAINTEAHIKRIYNYVTPLDGALPHGSALILVQGTRQPASVTVPRPFTHTLTMTWSIDGATAGAGAEFMLDTRTLSPGDHTLSVQVTDATALVRSDPARLLRTTRSWAVTIAPVFSDHPLAPGATIRAVHITELRARIAALRLRCGKEAVTYTDASLVAGVTTMRAVHIAELRTALLEAYDACGESRPSFSDAALAGGVIRAAHISELRSAILALE